MPGLHGLGVSEAAELLRGGREAVEEYYSALYERIGRLDERLRGFITLRPREEVIEEAVRALEEARDSPLAGVPVAVKDNIHVEGLPVTCGSRMLEKYVAVYNATVVERLRRLGAVVIGKTNMDEFAMGSTGETSAFGAARNPWSPDRVPGGSSSGSAVALAAGYAPLALGSDTGGSIRLPASWTGLYGYKPLYGRVSRYGLVSYADSLEQIGPMARSVEDLALLYEAIAGHDPRDSTSLRGEPPRALEAARRGALEGATGLRVAVAEEFLDHPGVSPEARSLVERAAELLERSGATVEHARLGREVADYSLPAYYVIAMAEASSNLARYDGVRYGPRVAPEPWESWNRYYSRIRARFFGREVKLRIMLGSWLLSSGYRDQYYVRALKLRRLVKERLESLLRGYEAVLMPSAVAPPPRLGDAVEDPLQLYALDLANVVANLAGLPAIAAPVAKVGEVPIGAQLLGRPSREGEENLFTLAAALQEETRMKNLVAEP